MRRWLAPINIISLIIVFLLSISSLALATTVDSAVYTALKPVTTDAANDNGLDNANKTGVGVSINDGSAVFNKDGTLVAPNLNVIKSTDMNFKFDINGVAVLSTPGAIGVQRTHGEYQNNTNSCASCHQTHTGASKALLFKNGVYYTCTACHDGTLGFYNVFAASSAGTFGGTVAGHASVHMADGSMKTMAAPGGNRTGKDIDLNDLVNWTSEFTCASCHSPHGSYSDRLLNYNPNGMAVIPMRDDDRGTYTGITKAANGGVNALTGGAMVRSTVLAAAPDLSVVNATTSGAIDATLLDYATYPEYVTVQMTASDVPVYNSTTDTVSLPGTSTWRNSLPVAAQPAADAKVVVVLKRMLTIFPYTAVYVKDTMPWISGGEYNNSHSFIVNYAGFYTGAALDINSTSNSQFLVNEAPVAPATAFDNIKLNYLYGFAKLPDAAGSVATLDGKGAQLLTNTAQFTLKGIVYPVRRYLFKDSLGVALTADNCKNDAGDVIETANATSKTTLVGQNADISRAFVLKLAMDPVVSWFGAPTSGVKITKVDPASYDTDGLAISTFCAACHTDYLVKSGSAAGVWSKAFRHTTNSPDITCLKCHFAHGSDVTVILDTQDRDITRAANELFGGPSNQATIDATAYLLDMNPSSVLKRYTNTSVCRKCHVDYTY